MKIKFECKWGKNKYLNIYLIITVLIMLGAFWVGYELISGLSDALEIKKLFWGIILSIDTATAVALAFLAYFGYKDYAKGEDEIPIFIEIDGNIIKKEKFESLKLLRKYITRAEILGVLGMIQNDSQVRFNLDYAGSPKFLKQINEVQKGKKDEIVVKVSEKEFFKYFSKYFNKGDLSKKEIIIVMKTGNEKYIITSIMNIYGIQNEIKNVLKKYLKNDRDCLKIRYLKDECFYENIKNIENNPLSKPVIELILTQEEFKQFDENKLKKG